MCKFYFWVFVTTRPKLIWDGIRRKVFNAFGQIARKLYSLLSCLKLKKSSCKNSFEKVTKNSIKSILRNA